MDEHIRRSVFQEPKEVRGKRGTREAISLQGVFAVFTEILTLPTLTIGMLEQRWGELRQRGHPKAGIGPVLTHFRFHHAVAGLRPTLGRIGKGLKVLPGLFGSVKTSVGFA